MKPCSETRELGTPKGLWQTVLNSEVVLFLRSISMYWIGIGTDVAVLNSQGVPISQVVPKIGFTVYSNYGNWQLVCEGNTEAERSGILWKDAVLAVVCMHDKSACGGCGQLQYDTTG